jgi:hypothetical protein
LKDEIRAEWLDGKSDADATRELLQVVREASAADASKKTVALLNRGVSPASVWDAVFAGAGELLMRQPGIRALHAVTTSNALHFAWDHTRDEALRKFLLLQAASFVPLFRGDVKGKTRIDELEPASKPAAVEDIFAEISNDRNAAARKLLGHLNAAQNPKEFVDAARLVLFFKGRDAHDYKFSSAVLEDWEHMSPGWRERYLAASVFQLRGSGGSDNEVVKRTRAALAG